MIIIVVPERFQGALRLFLFHRAQRSFHFSGSCSHSRMQVHFGGAKVCKEGFSKVDDSIDSFFSLHRLIVSGK